MGLVHNWGSLDLSKKKGEIKILDTSLRDGLQDPSITQPKLSEKLKLVELFSKVGIDAADIGFPVSSEFHKKEVIETAKHIVKNKLGIKICVLARTQPADIKAAIEVSQKAGCPVEAITIIGSSKVRHFVEKWDYKQIKKWIKESVQTAVKNGLEVNFLTEDGTRTEPKVIKELYLLAIDSGATIVTLADTVGAANPLNAFKMVKFLKDNVIKDKNIIIDWHGHNDRDMATTNSLWALRAGAQRAHVTVLGIGERAGNSAMEPLLFNLQMEDAINKNLKYLQDLTDYSSKIFKINIPNNFPGIGKSVHSTAVGIHASAIMKARNINREDLANTVYSGVDAQMFGRKTEIYIGPLSGKANALYVLPKLKIKPTEENIQKVLDYSRNKNVILKEEEIKKILKP